MKIVLFLLILTYAFGFDLNNYPNSTTFDYNYIFHWKVEGNNIFIALEVQTTGWVGFGIGEPTSGSMPGADILTGYVIGGQGSIQDRFATAKALPSIDTQQSWQLVSAEETNGWTIIEVSRALNTGDAQDRPIVSGLNRIIWSYGTTDEVQYHGSNRGVGALVFYGENPDANPHSETEVYSYDLVMDGFTIPTQRTTYGCTKVLRAPNFSGPQSHIIEIEAVIAEATQAYVHHFQVYGCKQETQWLLNRTTTFSEMCAPIGKADTGCDAGLWTWAPGMGPFILPPVAGFLMGPNDDSFKYFLIEIHYDNPNLVSGLVDYSGIRIKYTPQLREHNVGSLTLGDGVETAPAIDGGSSCVHYEFSCSASCTSTWPYDINVFASFLHMHKMGSMIWSTHHRGNQLLGYTNRVEYWDYGLQQLTPTNFTIKKGDRINTHCVYDTSSSSESVSFGIASNQEMCLEFLFYWPQIPNMPLCGYVSAQGSELSICGIQPIFEQNPTEVDPPGGEVRQFGGQNIQPQCIDKTGVAEEDSSSIQLGIASILLILCFCL